MRINRELVNRLPIETFHGGDQVGTNSLRYKIDIQIGMRIERPRAAVRRHRHARHRFDATGHHQMLPAGTYFLRRQVHRFQARGAETVDLHASGVPVPAGCQRSGFGDVGALVTDRGDAAKHHIVDVYGIEIVIALGQRLHQAGEQSDRFDLVQGAVFLAFAARGTNGIVDECLGHAVLLKSCVDMSGCCYFLGGACCAQ